MRPAVRLFLVVALIVAVLGLGVHYYTDGPEYPYPAPQEIATDYDDHVGTDVLLFSTVESMDPSRATAIVRAGYPGGALELTVDGFEGANVRPGGTVQVYGTLETDGRIDAENLVVVNSKPTTDRDKYILSGIGALLVLVVFVQNWTVDLHDVGFVPR